jgi:chromate transporter
VIDALLLFWLMFKAALFSTSGSGNLPILHQDLLARGWATDRNFAESLAIGQISPGPSGLWVISLGYLLDGLRGALLTLVAITLPPLVVLLIDGFYRRYGDHPALQGFVRGLSLAVSGIFFVVLAGIMNWMERRECADCGRRDRSGCNPSCASAAGAGAGGARWDRAGLNTSAMRAAVETPGFWHGNHWADTLRVGVQSFIDA